MKLLPQRLLGLVLVLVLGLLGGAVLARDEPQRISVEAAAAAMAEPMPPLFLDVRGRREAAATSIPKAINVGNDPLAFRPDGKGNTAVLIVPWPPERTVVDAWRGRLEAFGYTVSILDGGFPAWKSARLPVIEMTEPITTPGSVPFTIPRGLCESNTPAQVFR